MVIKDPNAAVYFSMMTAGSDPNDTSPINFNTTDQNPPPIFAYSDLEGYPDGSWAPVSPSTVWKIFRNLYNFDSQSWNDAVTNVCWVGAGQAQSGGSIPAITKFTWKCICRENLTDGTASDCKWKTNWLSGMVRACRSIWTDGHPYVAIATAAHTNDGCGAGQSVVMMIRYATLDPPPQLKVPMDVSVQTNNTFFVATGTLQVANARAISSVKLNVYAKDTDYQANPSETLAEYDLAPLDYAKNVSVTVGNPNISVAFPLPSVEQARLKSPNSEVYIMSLNISSTTGSTTLLTPAYPLGQTTGLPLFWIIAGAAGFLSLLIALSFLRRR